MLLRSLQTDGDVLKGCMDMGWVMGGQFNDEELESRRRGVDWTFPATDTELLGLLSRIPSRSAGCVLGNWSD